MAVRLYAGLGPQARAISLNIAAGGPRKMNILPPNSSFGWLKRFAFPRLSSAIVPRVDSHPAHAARKGEENSTNSEAGY